MQIGVKYDHYANIVSGRKTVEGRRIGGAFDHVKSGDKIKFMNGPKSVDVVCTAIRFYRGQNSLRTFLAAEMANALPGFTDIEKGVLLYTSLGPGWSESDIDKRGGMVAIEFKKVPVLSRSHKSKSRPRKK